MSTEWASLPTQPNLSSDVSYFKAVHQQQQAPFSVLSFSMHEDPASHYTHVPRVPGDSISHSPQRRPVTGRFRLKSPSYQSNVPFSINQDNAPKENKCVKYFNLTIGVLKWTLWNAAWPTLRATSGLVLQCFLFIKSKTYDRQPQVLTLPNKIDETHLGWDVQAKQLAFEMTQLQSSLVTIQNQKPEYPLKFALEITFSDGEQTQTVLSTLLISNQKEWKKFTLFVDKLYPQIVHMRHGHAVSENYSMRLAFAALCRDPSEDDQFFVFQRSNQYKNGTQAKDISSDVQKATCDKGALSEMLQAVQGIETAKAWLENQKNWSATGKQLATYKKGEEDPLPLVVED